MSMIIVFMLSSNHDVLSTTFTASSRHIRHFPPFLKKEDTYYGKKL